MSILEKIAQENQSGRVTQFRRGNGGNNADLPKAKTWLNIGYTINGRFVNLPLGMPLDTMQPAAATGQNSDWVSFQTARNNLLQRLQNIGDNLQPGEEVDVPVLTIKIRRVNEELQADAGEYGIDLDSMFADLKPTKPTSPTTAKQDEEDGTIEPDLTKVG